MTYSHLGVMLTKKCTASCDTCCFNCTPRSKETLEVDMLKQFLSTTTACEDLRQITFTGGEPFVMREELYDLISFVVKVLHKEASVVTNCYWANSPTASMEVVSRLKTLGVRKLSLSYDHYHSRYVPASYVMNALDACHALQVATVMCSVVAKGEQVSDLIADLGDSFHRTVYETDYVIPIGRAKSAFTADAFVRCCDVRDMKCPFDGSLSIASNGKIYPCCSQTVLDSCIEIGDYVSDTFEQVTERANNNGLLYLVRNIGFEPFYGYATQALGWKLPEKYVRPCELCQLLFSSEEKLDDFAPLIDMEIRGVLERSAKSRWK